MGNKTIKRRRLSTELTKQCQEVFQLMDKDNGGSIDKEEAINHWSSSFGKISAKEFFEAVDENKDGKVELSEFIHFWEVVKGAGHPEEEITEELERIRKGESWVGFEDLPKNYMNRAEDGEESSKVNRRSISKSREEEMAACSDSEVSNRERPLEEKKRPDDLETFERSSAAVLQSLNHL